MGRRDRNQALAALIAVPTIGLLPPFLLGGLVLQIRTDLRFSEATLGMLVAFYYAAAAAVSRIGGRMADNVGATRVLRVAIVATALVLAGMGLAPHWWFLPPLLAIAGMAQSTIQPASNLLAIAAVPHRLGLAFGIKQSAAPAAIVLAGVAVPSVALTVGWRWAFLGGAAVGLCVVPLIPRLPNHRPGPGTGTLTPRSERSTLRLLALTLGLGAGAATSLGAFAVLSGVRHAGFTETEAALAFAGGSALSIVARMWIGFHADRSPAAGMPLVAGMLFVGAGGFFLLATGQPVLFLLGVALAFSAGWGWPGLFNLCIVRANPVAPGSATGITQVGAYLGCVVGPVLFGLIVDRGHDAGAWMVTGMSAVAAGIAAIVGGRHLARPPRPSPAVFGIDY